MFLCLSAKWAKMNTRKPRKSETLSTISPTLNRWFVNMKSGVSSSISCMRASLDSATITGVALSDSATITGRTWNFGYFQHVNLSTQNTVSFEWEKRYLLVELTAKTSKGPTCSASFCGENREYVKNSPVGAWILDKCKNPVFFSPGISMILKSCEASTERFVSNLSSLS